LLKDAELSRVAGHCLREAQSSQSGNGSLVEIRSGDQVAHAISVYAISQLSLGGNLVAFGYGDIAHVVAEARYFEMLRFVPADRSAGPCGNLGNRILILPEADRNFACQPQKRRDEAELATAMRRLVQVHEVHVDGGPRQFTVELGVQVQEWPGERSQPGDPHLRWREGMHPEDEADAVLLTVGVATECAHLFGSRQHWLEHYLERDRRICVERRGDLLRVLPTLGRGLQDRRDVDSRLRTKLPDLQISSCSPHSAIRYNRLTKHLTLDRPVRDAPVR
jgi:hypothetical protein